MENEETDISLKSVISKTFLWMFLGLIATALVSWYTYSSGLFEQILEDGMFDILLIAEVVVVLIFSALFRKLPPLGASILFFIYAIVNGVSLSVIFAVFELNSIVLVLVAAGLIFAILAFIGYKTDRDMTKFGNICMVALFVGVLVSIINIFLKNSMVDIVLDWFILILFFGITIYDMNKIKELAEEPSVDIEKVHIYGAMELYLDYINIFLRILSLFGKRRD